MIPNSSMYDNLEEKDQLQQEFIVVRDTLAQCDTVASFIASVGVENYRQIRNVMMIIDVTCPRDSCPARFDLMKKH